VISKADYCTPSYVKRMTFNKRYL